MLRVYLLAIATVAIVGAAPETYVRWMEIQEAESTAPDVYVLSYQPYETSWETFKQTHGKSYEPKEEIHRYNIFLQNVAYIESHNKLYRDGKSTFYLGLNHFADYELEEYKKLNGFRGNVEEITGSTYMEASFTTLPASVDWRTKGYVTAVKNQGQCGSCWSFSATGSLEGQHFKATGELKSLSEQQLVDCSTAFGNHGCQGGLMDQAFSYIKAAHGIDSEKSYPYLAKQEQSCHYNKSAISATCTGFVDIPQGSESALQSATATVGPISVAIDAGHRSFQLYHGGVYDEPECSPVRLDHGVLAVGYGTDQGVDYWLVKNSWGEGWGLQGYIMMSRNRHNQCGIASKASYPLV